MAYTMNKPIQSVGVIAKPSPSAMTQDTLKVLLDYLIARKIPVTLTAETAQLFSSIAARVVALDVLGQQCDLVIVVGGDGSLLHAAHHVAKYGTPLIGINRGTLGFLTDINPQHLAAELESVLAGHYRIESRFCLGVTIDDSVSALSWGLNEIVILPGSVPHLTEFEIRVAQQFVCRQRADGLIIATPTGSTAYALSAGGPILHSELDAIVLVPMFPHSLNNRPLVISGQHKIQIRIAGRQQHTLQIACDGQHYSHINSDSLITIQKMAQHVQLVHPLHYDYFSALRSKLHWGQQCCTSIE